MEKEKRERSKLNNDYAREFIINLMKEYPKDRITPRRKITGLKLYLLREYKRNPKNKYKKIISRLDNAEKIFKFRLI